MNAKQVVKCATFKVLLFIHGFFFHVSSLCLVFRPVFCFLPSFHQHQAIAVGFLLAVLCFCWFISFYLLLFVCCGFFYFGTNLTTLTFHWPLPVQSSSFHSVKYFVTIEISCLYCYCTDLRFSYDAKNQTTTAAAAAAMCKQSFHIWRGFCCVARHSKYLDSSQKNRFIMNTKEFERGNTKN